MKEAEFPPCPKRQRLVMFAADGRKAHVFRCTEQTAPKAAQDVDAADCEACPVRRAMLEGLHTPPTRKVPGEVKPDGGGGGFVPCDLRGVVGVKACCGATRTIRVCENDGCHYFQGEVNPHICAGCPVRSSGPSSGQE